jgi:hypothetical protein
MEKIAFVEFVLLASLGLLLFGSKLTVLTHRFNRKPPSSEGTSGLETRPSHR